MPGNIGTPTPEEIAKWPEPDYENGIRREWMPVYSIVILVFTTSLVAIRVGLRLRKQGGGLGLDDALLLPSWLLLIGFTACAIWVSNAGIIDRHIWDLEPNKFEADALNAFISQLIFLLGTCCIKVSILLFHRRMVQGTFARRWQWAVWSAIAFTISYTIVLVFLLIFNCTPTEAYWRSGDPTYNEDWHCLETKWVNYFAGILALLSDFYSLCLPWAMIWPLELPRRQKIGLNAVFGLGIFVIVVAGLRTYALVKLGTGYDLTWIGFMVYLWSLLEWNLGIICACAPSLRVFFRKYLKSSLNRAIDSHSTRKRTYGSSSDNKFGSSGDTESLPAHVIEMERTLTIESSTPFAKGDVQHSVRQSESSTASFSSSHRQGVSQVPRAYRNALKGARSISHETLGQASQREPTALPPVPDRMIADQDTIAKLMRGG